MSTPQLLNYLVEKHESSVRLKEKKLELEERKLALEEKRIALEAQKWNTLQKNN